MSQSSAGGGAAGAGGAESAATLESVEQEVASLRLAYREPRAGADRLGIAAASRASRSCVHHYCFRNTRTRGSCSRVI